MFNPRVNRRELLVSAAALSAAAAFSSVLSAQSKPATTQAALPDNLTWHDVRDGGVEGRGFDDTESYFDRLPKRAKGVVRPEVWSLSRNTAGMSVRFASDSPALYIRYETTSPTLAMPHMPATGVSGVDLYTQLDGQWHWMATHSPKAAMNAAAIAQNVPTGKRAYLLNLPLYNGVKSLEIGVPKGTTFEPTAPRKAKPILFYGTSITQGGCASRPGMAFCAILGRRLDRPMLNFGFSGNGRMEIEVARFLAELDPAIFVLDCMGNMLKLPIKPRTIEVTKYLREKHPQTPILMLEERINPDAVVMKEKFESHRERCAEMRAAYDELVADGIGDLHYQKGDDLIGADGEGTVDGSHPNDLGMMRYADALEPTLRALLS
jgi:hypothetical protein